MTTSASKVDEGGIIYYQGYRSPRALERERAERQANEEELAKKLKARYDEEKKGSQMTYEDVLKAKSKKYGLKSLRRGAK